MPNGGAAPVAVVTGASGFVGSHLVEALVAAGWRVRRLVRPGSAGLPADVAPGAAATPAWTVDLADPRALAACDALDGADALLHVAGVTRARTRAAFDAGNVAPTRALLAALAARAGAGGDARREAPPRLVLVSSQAAAGAAEAPDRPRTERDPPAPVGAYGASKRAAEALVEATDPARLPWAIVRPSAVYGPRDPDFARVRRLAARGLAVTPHLADAWLSLVHATDLADALVRAATAPGAVGRALFVAAEEAVPWPAVYAAFAAAAGTRIRLALDLPAWVVTLAGAAGDAWGAVTGTAPLVTREKVRLGRPRHWVCSAAEARRVLGWAPRVPLAEGAATVDA